MTKSRRIGLGTTVSLLIHVCIVAILATFSLKASSVNEMLAINLSIADHSQQQEQIVEIEIDLQEQDDGGGSPDVVVISAVPAEELAQPVSVQLDPGEAEPGYDGNVGGVPFKGRRIGFMVNLGDHTWLNYWYWAEQQRAAGKPVSLKAFAKLRKGSTPSTYAVSLKMLYDTLNDIGPDCEFFIVVDSCTDPLLFGQSEWIAATPRNISMSREWIRSRKKLPPRSVMKYDARLLELIHLNPSPDAVFVFSRAGKLVPAIINYHQEDQHDYHYVIKDHYQALKVPLHIFAFEDAGFDFRPSNRHLHNRLINEQREKLEKLLSGTGGSLQILGGRPVSGVTISTRIGRNRLKHSPRK